MLLSNITPLLITLDEAPNLSRTLAKIQWANRIVVVDSGSVDGTLDILERYSKVQVFRRTFTTFAEQCNFGLAQIQSEWVLSLDADYVLSDAFVRELTSVEEVAAVGGYEARFVYRVYGRPLRGTLYPPRTVLYRVKGARYVDEGHAHRVCITGSVATMEAPIFHDDRKPIERWFRSQQQYARIEARHLSDVKLDTLSYADRIRRAGWPAPIFMLFYVWLVKGCLFDGWAGWFYTLQRVLAEAMLALEIVDRRLRKASAEGCGQSKGRLRAEGERSDK